MDKFILWLSAISAETSHSINSTSADSAHTHHMSDRVRGVERVVDRNLERISQREQSLSEFARHIAESTSLNDDNA
jgi:hypothetical protein